MKHEKFLLNDKITVSSLTNMIVSQTLYQKLKTTICSNLLQVCPSVPRFEFIHFKQLFYMNVQFGS